MFFSILLAYPCQVVEYFLILPCKPYPLRVGILTPNTFTLFLITGAIFPRPCEIYSAPFFNNRSCSFTTLWNLLCPFWFVIFKIYTLYNYIIATVCKKSKPFCQILLHILIIMLKKGNFFKYLNLIYIRREYTWAE